MRNLSSRKRVGFTVLRGFRVWVAPRSAGLRRQWPWLGVCILAHAILWPDSALGGEPAAGQEASGREAEAEQAPDRAGRPELRAETGAEQAPDKAGRPELPAETGAGRTPDRAGPKQVSKAAGVQEGGEDEETIVVRGYRILAADRTTGFVESIEVVEEAKTLTSVSDVLGEAAGVQVRQLGGLGSYGAASIRGSTPSQVPVYLDGVLLNAGGFSTVDLGQLSLDALDTVEIYRGSAPLQLGASGIGGAVYLRTRGFEGPVSETAFSYGSWNTARVLALNADRIGDANLLMLFSVCGSEGDFRYLNRGGTPDDEDAYQIQRRQNNQHLAYAALAKVDSHVGDWNWTLANDLYTKQQGLAGIEGEPTENAALRTFRDSFHVAVGGSLTPSVELSLDAGLLAMQEDLRDEGTGAEQSGEIGVDRRRTRSVSNAPGGGVLLQIAHGESNVTRSRLDGRYERFSWHTRPSWRDLRGEFRSEPQHRLRGLVGIEHEWWVTPDMTLVPAFRGELHHSRFAGGQLSPGAEPWPGTSSVQAFWTPALGWRWELLDGLVLRANSGRYVRPPEMTELFGDRGMAVGNPQLRPEVGLHADAGVTHVMQDLGFISAMRLDAAWFGCWMDDLIVYEQNSQSTVRPENVASADMLGFESGLRLGLYDLVVVEGNYTYLYAINRTPGYLGYPLPGRPAHEVFGKIQVEQVLGGWAAAGWCETDYAAENYVKRAAQDDSWVAPRFLLALGLRVERPLQGLSLTVEVKNLLDTITFEDSQGRPTPFRDFEGFPLPGRTVLATLHWRMAPFGGKTL